MTDTSGRPRLLFVSYTAEWTGPTHSLLLLVRHLREEYELAVVVPGTGIFTDRLAAQGIQAYSLSSLGVRAIPSLVRIIRQWRPGLVYANDTGGGSRNALVAAKWCRVPFVCHIRAMARPRDWRRRGFLRFANAAIAVSEACLRAHARYLPPGAGFVVHNGIDPAQAERGDARAARMLLLDRSGLPSDSLILTNVGHLSVRKAQHRLVRALARIVSVVPAARLVLVGHLTRDAAYTAYTKSLARELGVEDRVRFLGFEPDVRLLLQGSDVYLHSASDDPHPRAVLEAMAAGLAVVAFAVDGVAETVIDGETGCLVPVGDTDGLADAVVRLATNARLRTGLGEAGRNRVLSEFTADVTAAKVRAIIGPLLMHRSVASQETDASATQSRPIRTGTR